MGYASSTLADGEILIRRARFNWTYDFASWFWLAFGAAPSIFLFLLIDERGWSLEYMNTALGYACMSAFVLGAAVLLARYIRKWTTVIAVTSTRLIYKSGVIGRTSHDISIEKVEEVDLRQSLLGRLFGYGRLIIGGEGIGLIELPPIGDPVAFLRDLESAASERRNGAARKDLTKHHLRSVPAGPVRAKPLSGRARRVAG